MKIEKTMSYGIDKNTDERFLYPERIILRDYENEGKNNKIFLDLMSEFKIYQHNYNDSKTSDYFMWQNVNENGEKDYTHLDFSCYQNNTESIFKMWDLLKICETLYIDIKVLVKFSDIRTLIEEINNDIEFEKSVKKEEK